MNERTPENAPEGADAPEQQPAFEAALEKLEAIVKDMEEGKLPIETMMAKFEEGVKLAGYCKGRLDEISGKIEVLAKKAGGEEWQEFETGDAP